MATYNLTSTQRGGQRIVSDSSGNNAELEKRVSKMEDKLDKILNLLENKKENIKND